MRRNVIVFLSFVFFSLLVYGQKTSEQNLKPTGVPGRYIAVQKPVYFDVSPPLREMIKNSTVQVSSENRDLEEKIEAALERYFKEKLKGKPSNEPDPLSKIQQTYNKTHSKGADLLDLANFDGVDNQDGVAPPDTQGDVNSGYYMQCVNNHTGIYTRDGNEVVAPFPTSDFWQGTGFDDRNDGDAVILWDEDAQRWVVTQFYLPSSGDQYLLVAVSTTSDPTGSYYRYAFAYTYMPDYPKWAIWHDGYYVGANAFDQNNNYSFEGVYISAFDREAMINGQSNPTAVTILDANLWSVFPVDADVIPDPSIGGCYFITDELSDYTGNDEVYLYQFNVNWANSSGTLDLVKTFTVTSYDVFDSDQATVPQPGTSQKLDLLHYRTMYRSYFRAFKDHQSIVMARTVKDGTVAAIRWYEFRNSGSGWTVYQQGTYNPGDGDWRWLPSIAMNAQGDIALGYSVSSSSTYPSIRLVARYADDPLGVMTSNEYEAYTGSSSQTNVSRWGDYAMVSIDPDFYSFWFTTEYTTGSWNWKTRIIHFDLPRTCTGPSTQASNLSLVSKTNNSATLSWTRGNGDSVLIIARRDYPVNIDPVNGQNYSANSQFGSGDELAPGDFAVYNGSGSTVTVTDLQAGHWYYFSIYEYNAADFCYNLDEDTLRIYIDCDGPSVQASDFQLLSANDNDLTVSWDRGNGDSVLVVVREGSAVSSDPQDGQSYNASIIFGQGDQIGIGNYVVYNGTDTMVTVTGLKAGTTYYFAIYEYFSGDFCYNKNELTGSATTTGSAPCTSYCDASGGGDEYISGVILGDINNVNTGEDGYVDYTDMSTDLYLGQSYTITIQNGNSYSSDDVGVWIDWNHDCDFDDPGENVVCGVDDGADGDYTFTVPSDAQLGETRMRVRIKYYNSDCGDPCGTTSYGEVEDYTVNVLDPNAPTIYVSTEELNIGDVGLGYYATETYKVAGHNLTDDITLTLSGDDVFGISLDGNTYSNSLTLPQSGGTVDTTVIYVRLQPTVEQTYSGVILHQSSGASSKTVSLYGKGQQWFPAPQNLTATPNGSTVELAWDEPANGGSSANWYFYADINSSSYYYGSGFITQMSKFDDDDLGYTYPIKITQLRAGFYNNNNEWTSDQFHFVIFGMNLDTIFKSPALTAVSGQEVTYTLPDPLFITGDFYMGIITEASDGTPYLLLKKQTDNNYHSYAYDGSGWYYLSDGTYAYDWDLGVYVDNNAKGYWLTSMSNDDNSGGLVASMNVKPTGQAQINGQKSALYGYKIYKDGSELAQVDANTFTYTDNDGCGTHSYYVTALYQDYDGESDPSDTATSEIPTTTITQQPQSQEACEGSDVTFTVQATGSNLTYQWYKDGSAISGATSDTYTISSATSSDAGTYYCEISGDCGNATSETATLTVNENTTITQQPQSQDVCEGESVQFSVSATGTNLTYQWYKDGSAISGATSNTYTISSATVSDAGSYYCVVSGDCGNVTSNTATLNVYSGTTITQQPQDQNVCVGSEVTFSVVAEGVNLTYQWYKDGSAISGATSDTYTISNVALSDAGTYYCEVSGDCGNATSETATLTVGEGATITQQPESQEVCEGEDVTFSVVAEGDNLTYQWYKDGSAISGATSDTYTITNVSVSDAGDYYCVITASCGTLTSETATLTVSTGTTITQQPQDQTVCVGSVVTFSVVAEGSNLSYQWYKDGSEISGATSATYVIDSAALSDAGTYYCEVSGDCGNATSETATLTVGEGATITQQPESQEVCEGEDVTFSVVAEGDNLTYQWYKDGSAISGATSDTYTITNVSVNDAGEYYCEITASCGTLTSETATLSVSSGLEITSQPQDLVATVGDTVSFTIEVSVSEAQYQWRKDGVDLADNEHITGATTNTLTINAVAEEDQGNYTCYVESNCGSAESDTATLTVNVSLVVGAYKMVAYPNPTTGLLTLEFDRNLNNAAVIITDALGKVVYRSTINGNLKQIDISYLANGVYQLKVVGSYGNITTKIVKK